jgi:hypothetical protein
MFKGYKLAVSESGFFPSNLNIQIINCPIVCVYYIVARAHGHYEKKKKVVQCINLFLLKA